MFNLDDDSAYEPEHTVSPTGQVLTLSLITI